MINDLMIDLMLLIYLNVRDAVKKKVGRFLEFVRSRVDPPTPQLFWDVINLGQ